MPPFNARLDTTGSGDSIDWPQGQELDNELHQDAQDEQQELQDELPQEPEEELDHEVEPQEEVEELMRLQIRLVEQELRRRTQQELEEVWRRQQEAWLQLQEARQAHQELQDKLLMIQKMVQNAQEIREMQRKLQEVEGMQLELLGVQVRVSVLQGVQQRLKRLQETLQEPEPLQQLTQEVHQTFQDMQRKEQELNELLRQLEKAEELLQQHELQKLQDMQQELQELQDVGQGCELRMPKVRQRLQEVQRNLEEAQQEELELRQELQEEEPKIEEMQRNLQLRQQQELILYISGVTRDEHLDAAVTVADRLQPQTLRRLYLSSPRTEPLLDELLVVHSNALEVVKLSCVTPRSSASVGTLGLLSLCSRLRLLGLPLCEEMPLLLECPGLVVLELHLDGGELGSAALYLRDAVRLTSLSLYCPASSSEMAKAAVELVGALSSSGSAALESLRIHSSALVVDGDLVTSALVALAGLPRLRELCLSGVPPTSFITALADEVPSLRLLDFREAGAALKGSDCPVPALRALLAARPALHVKGVASRGAACECLGCAGTPWWLMMVGAPCGFYAHDHGNEDCGVEHDGGVAWCHVTPEETAEDGGGDP